MDQENYVEGCSMQRPPLLEPNGSGLLKKESWEKVSSCSPIKIESQVSKTTTKEKVKSSAHKDKVTREQTSDDSDIKDGSDEESDEEEQEHLVYWLGTIASSSVRVIDLGAAIDLAMGPIECHFASECRKPKENKAFVGGAWSDSEDGDKQLNDATCLMAIDSQEVVSKPSSSNIDLNIIKLQKENEELLKFNKDFTKTFEKLLKEKCSLENKNSKLSSKINDLEIEVKKLANDKEVIEPCKSCDALTKEVDSLKCNVSKLQDEALNFLNSNQVALL
ncbi:hypothetical protein Tco_0660318 [Tanacetum coccineum]